MSIIERISKFFPNRISRKEVQKLVTISSETIPGNSIKEIQAFKKEIARFAKKNELQNVDFFDPRIHLGEDVSPVTENRLAGQIGISVTKGNEAPYTYVDYFKEGVSLKKKTFNALNSFLEVLNPHKPFYLQ